MAQLVHGVAGRCGCEGGRQERLPRHRGLHGGRDAGGGQVQVRNRNDYPQRSAYYLSALHASQMRAGDSYLDLKKTISIHILAFSLFAGDRFRRAFSLRDEETGERLCEDLRLVYLEVPKYVQQGVPRNRLEY